MVKLIRFKKYKFLFDRVIKTIEGSFIFVFYANINPSDKSFLYSLSLVGLVTSFLALPNINPYLQKYASEKNDSIPLSFLLDKIVLSLSFLCLVCLFSDKNLSFSEIFLILSMGSYAFVQFFYLNNRLNDVFEISLMITFVSIFFQLAISFFSLPFYFLFYVKGFFYIFLIFIIILKSKSGKVNHLFKWFGFKQQIQLYVTGCVYGFLINYDVLHFSTIDSNQLTEYFTVKKISDFIFVLFSWWGVSLPNKLDEGISFHVFIRRFLFFILAVVILFFAVNKLSGYYFESYQGLTYFILFPIVFILDVFFTRFAIFKDINHLELFKYILRALGVLLLIECFNVELYYYPLCYFLVCLISYTSYIFYFRYKHL